MSFQLKHDQCQMMDFDDLLIMEVKKYPNLYDNTSLEYKDSYKKQLAWMNVAETLGQKSKLSFFLINFNSKFIVRLSS